MGVNNCNDLGQYLDQKRKESKGKNIIMKVIGSFSMILNGKKMEIELLKNTVNGEVMHNIKSVEKL